MKKLVEEKFLEEYGRECQCVFSSGGRFEIIGNHTDHNHGKCIAATCNQCITCAVAPRDDNTVNFFSLGFGKYTADLNNLTHILRKTNSSEIIKGIAKYFQDKGYKYGGFDAYSNSTIRPGAGVSSSAAFELLICKIFNELYNNNTVSTLEMCKAGQYSENNYYEKKSGLLDQIGVAYGNIVAIDFENIDNPKVEEIEFPFKDLHFVFVNSCGTHVGLNDLYSSIPQDMINAAKKSGHNFLRETTQKEIDSLNNLTEMETKRATHFFSENDRVDIVLKALKENDKETFLEAVNNSRISSTNNLKNMMVDNHYQGSPLEACDRAMEIMNGHGACKINGGGFAGSIICIVPNEYLNKFMNKMSEYYGFNNVGELLVRTTGPIKE